MGWSNIEISLLIRTIFHRKWIYEWMCWIFSFKIKKINSLENITSEFLPLSKVLMKKGECTFYIYLSFLPMIEFHRKWRFWLRQLEEIDCLVSRSSIAASSWCAGSLEGVISSSFQDYSQIDIDSCCTIQDLLHRQIHLLDWWMMIPTFWLRPHQRRIGGQCQSQFLFARKWRRCFFVFALEDMIWI